MVDKVTRCHKCGLPLAAQKSGRVRIRKNQKGGSYEQEVLISHSEGVVAIPCPRCVNVTPAYFITLKPKATSTLAR